MIVTCTNCQAKFRVADEKIGPRGAKVRCSKCQTVFLVRREGAEPAASASASGPAPAPAALEIAPTRPSASPAVRAVPPPLPPPLPGTRPSDPFAATLATFPPPDAPAASPLDPAPPPFAPGGSPDPFAAAAPPDPFAPPPEPFPAPRAPDPFAPQPAPDPFAPAAASDPFAPPPTDPFSQPSTAASGPMEVGDGDLLGGGAPEPEAASAPPSLSAPASAIPPPDAAEDDGLALEERAPSPPKPASSAPFDVGGDAGYDAFAGDDAQGGFDPGALELGSPATAVPPLAAAAAADAPPVLSPAAPAAEAPRPAPRHAAETQDAAPAPERSAGAGRLRSVAVNVVALAALLVAAVVILALWRTEGPIDAAALRPAAIVSALRGGHADAPFAPRDVRSGLYERERAPPILFVRGTVVSRAPAPVARVQVRVELVRGGAVVASGEAIAGALPTPEELWSAPDAAALAQVAVAAARRAPAEVRPGDAVPFLVAIADPPADLSGASLRVHAAPAGSPAP